MPSPDVPSPDSPPRRLLVIKFSALGDIVQTLQVMQTVTRQWPDCEVTWIVHERFAAMVQAAPFVRQVITFPAKKRLRATFRIWKFLQKTPFDLVWDFQGLFRPALFALFAKAPQKWGFRRRGKGLGGISYTHFLPHQEGDELRHAITYLQRFPEQANLETTVTFPLKLKPTALFGDEKINAFLTEKSGKLFVIFTDSSREEKMWNGYVEISKLILENIPESRIVWCGLKTMPSPGNAPDDRFLNLQGKCTLEQMITVVRQPSVFIGNDSGPMHLAAALGNRVLALFGPTSPERFGPWPIGSPSSQIVVAPNGKMSELKSEAVFAALQTLLAREVTS